MADVADPDAWLWPGTRLRIARVLLDAEAPLTGSEVAHFLGGTHPSNVNRELVALEAARLVTVQGPDPADAPTAGRPSRFWRLDSEQRQIAEAVLASDPTPRRPQQRSTPTTRRSSDSQSPKSTASVARKQTATAGAGPARGDELVIAEASGTGVVDLMGVLAHSEAQVAVGWTALWGDELVLGFRGPRAPDSALGFIAELDAEGITQIRRATVSELWTGSEFVEFSQRPRR